MQDKASGLTYMQARYYDPVIGRFLSTDPIGYQDQLNLYAYVHNDPVNMVDPFGQQACDAKANCMEAEGFDPSTVIDARTIEPSQNQVMMANTYGQNLETTGDSERVAGITENSDGTVSIEENMTATTEVIGDTLSTSFTPTGNEDAILHSHPNKNSQTGVGPGPADDAAVKAMGVPNFIVHEGQTGVVGTKNGQYFFQSTEGGLGAMTKDEREQSQINLNNYQARNQQ